MGTSDKIATREKQGRDIVISAFGNKYDLVESTNEYDSWDMSGRTHSIDKPDENFFIEIKTRDVKSTDYDTCFLEYKKLSHLKHIANDYDAAMYYVCTYTDNVLYVFNLRNIDITQVYLKVKDAPKISMRINSEVESKIFLELPFSLGKKYTIKN